MADAGFAHFAGADDHDGFGRKVFIEDAFSEFYSDAAHGCRAATNDGPGADLFGDLEGALEQAIGDATREFGVMGGLVGLLDLASDFGFAQDHRIEAARDREEVFSGCGTFFDVKVWGKIDVAV